MCYRSLLVLIGCCFVIQCVGHSLKGETDGLEALTRNHFQTEPNGNAADTLLAKNYLLQIDTLMRAGSFQQTVEKAKAAESIFLKYLPADHPYLADSWHHMGRAYNGLSNYEQSALFYNKALELRLQLYGDKDMRIAESYFGLGNLNDFMDKKEEAVRYYEKTVNIYEINNQKCNARLGDILQNLATSYRGQKQLDKTKSTLLKAIETYQCSGNYRIEYMANAYTSLSWYYNIHEHNTQQAIDYQKLAIDLILKERGPDNPFLMNGYGNMGSIYKECGLHVKAKEYFQKSIDIIENKYGTESSYAIRDYLNLGNVSQSLSQPLESKNYFLKAYAIARKIFGENSRQVNKVYNNLTEHHASQDELDKAEYYALKSLDFWEKKATKKSQAEHANAYENYARILIDKKQYDKAEALARRALEMKYEIYINDNKWTAFSYSQLGLILSEKGDYEQAKVAYEKARQIEMAEIGMDHPEMDWIEKDLGEFYAQQDSLQLALKQFQKVEVLSNYTGINQLNDVYSLNGLINNLHNKGIVLERLYDKEGNLGYLMEAYETQKEMEAVKKYRAHEILDGKTEGQDLLTCNCTEESSLSILNKMYKVKQDPIYVDEFLSSMESGKGIIMRQTTLNNHVNYTDLIDERHRVRELQFKNKIKELEKKRYLEVRDYVGKVKDSIFLEHTNDLLNKKSAYAVFVDSLATMYPSYHKLKYKTKVISLKGIRDSLLHSDKILVNYFIGDSSIFVLVITTDDFAIKEIKKDFPLENWVSELRCGLLPASVRDNSECGQMSDEHAQTQYVQAAQKIYQKLFAPLEEHFAGRNELILVPDGILGYVPFDALIKKAAPKAGDFHLHNYLLKDYQISYAYSATLLQEMKDRQHTATPKQFFIGYAPTFGNGQKEPAGSIAGNFNTRNATGPLRFNIPEVQAIQTQTGGRIYTDTSATRETFLSTASDARILHLSTHGKANDDLGDFSFLAFYQHPDSQATQARLYNRELYNLQLNADLVVLSACETGIGELQRGEGIISLARGFSYAGAKSIVTTLWRVDDEGSSKLMESFYQFLTSGMTKDAALKAAKQALMKDPKYSSPYYWGAVIPIGDMERIQMGSTWSRWWFLLLILPVLLVVFRKRK